MEDFDGVYQRYFPQVYRYLCALCRDSGLAEELAQETFVQALEHIERFRGSRHAWLCQIEKPVLELAEAEPAAGEDGRGAGAGGRGRGGGGARAGAETLVELHRRLHRLPEPYREVFSLRVFGELSYGQIAQIFEKSESWARVTTTGPNAD